MKLNLRNRQALAALLGIILLIGAFGTLNVNAQRRYYRGQHHSGTKGAVIGAVAGVLGGALIGGKRGAVIGAGAGAGTGYLIQRHRNNRDRRYRRYDRRDYRRY
jgi:uncharacterized protein YcfJ